MKNTVIDSPSPAQPGHKVKSHHKGARPLKQKRSLKRLPDQPDDTADLQAVDGFLQQISCLQCNIALEERGKQYPHGYGAKSSDLYHHNNQNLSENGPMAESILKHQPRDAGSAGGRKKRRHKIRPLPLSRGNRQSEQHCPDQYDHQKINRDRPCLIYAVALCFSFLHLCSAFLLSVFLRHSYVHAVPSRSPDGTGSTKETAQAAPPACQKSVQTWKRA